MSLSLIVLELLFWPVGAKLLNLARGAARSGASCSPSPKSVLFGRLGHLGLRMLNRGTGSELRFPFVLRSRGWP